MRLNPSYSYNLWTDDDIHQILARHAAEFMPYVKRLKPVELADLFRYLVLYIEGGLYADLDTEALVPVDDWGLTKPVTIGLEAVLNSEAERVNAMFSRQRQYCQFVMAFSTSGHPLLADVLDRILRQLHAGTPLPTQELTGPGVWTDAVEAYIADKGLGDLEVRSGDVFAAKGYSNSPVLVPGVSLIEHHYRGSWKDEGRGFVRRSLDAVRRFRRDHLR